MSKWTNYRNLGKPGPKGTYVIVSASNGVRFTVAKKFAPQFQGFINDLERAGVEFKKGQCGGYNYRKIIGGKSLSSHAYGMAIDINWNENPLGSSKFHFADLSKDEVIQICRHWGLGWGGEFINRKDTMHFQVVEFVDVDSMEDIVEVSDNEVTVETPDQIAGNEEDDDAEQMYS